MLDELHVSMSFVDLISITGIVFTVSLKWQECIM